MATMIPGFMDEGAPPGEKAVFRKLSEADVAWTVVHSLDLSRTRRGDKRTEIDFLLIIPDLGFLFVEVKSHTEVDLDNGVWSSRGERWTRSPFKQIDDGMYEFRRRLQAEGGAFAAVPFARCVVLSHAELDLGDSLEARAFELVDGREFRKLDSTRFARRLRSVLEESAPADPNHPIRELSADRVRAYAEFCKPWRKVRDNSQAERRERLRQGEEALRVPQKEILDLERDGNHRIIVDGPAGSGKTLIALELAARLAERGRRGALLCFNRGVGRWMAEELERTNRSRPHLFAGTAHSFLRQFLEIEKPRELPRDWWERGFLDCAEDKVTSDAFRGAQIDFVVCDESQDLFARPRLLAVVEQLVRDGWHGGEAFFFGDFRYQIVGNREVIESTRAGLERVAHPARKSLRENCRNFEDVGRAAADFSGFDGDLYEGFLKTGGGEKFDFAHYESTEQQVAKLDQWVREFREMGFRPRDIVILSFFREARAAAGRAHQLGGWPVAPFSASHDGAVAFASVSAFKGLERPVVILSDIDLEDSPPNPNHLLYIGLSRATEYARLSYAKRSRKKIMEWFVRGSED